MNKNFIKNESIFIAKKKIIFLQIFFIIFIILGICFLFIFQSNKFVIKNSIDIHKSNIELIEKIKILKKELDESNMSLKEEKKNNRELSNIFSKYTDAIKFKVATAEEVRKYIYEKDEKILQLGREINYYKFLLKSEKNFPIISIEELKTSLENSDRLLNYSFLLFSSTSDKKIKGTYSFYFDGINKKTSKKIFKKNLKLKNNDISFKNYLKLDGNLNIPDNVQIEILEDKYPLLLINGKILSQEVNEIINALRDKCPPPAVLNQLSKTVNNIRKVITKVDSRIDKFAQIPKKLDKPIKGGKVAVQILSHLPVPSAIGTPPGPAGGLILAVKTGKIQTLSSLLVWTRKMVEVLEDDQKAIKLLIEDSNTIFSPIKQRLDTIVKKMNHLKLILMLDQPHQHFRLKKGIQYVLILDITTLLFHQI